MLVDNYMQLQLDKAYVNSTNYIRTHISCVFLFCIIVLFSILSGSSSKFTVSTKNELETINVMRWYLWMAPATIEQTSGNYDRQDDLFLRSSIDP